MYIEIFSKVKDPRDLGKVKHELEDVLRMALIGVLSSLWLTGSLVSIDAMGTHRNIAEQIILQGGDYLMALKDNQPILKDLTENIFRNATPVSVYTTEEKGHDWKRGLVPLWIRHCWSKRGCTRDGLV